jgi:hypothetical protein|nr:MAG TPA: hypothetical protein [Caudoviricetes sp.]DAT00029.1 MAG TPA: hypothetical protein [Caudoviricetes sp.]
MKLTEFFRLRMPDGTDPVNIEDFNDNFEVIDKELKKRISSGESASDVTVEFEAAESRQPLKSGEKLSVLMGKAHRFFTDLKTVAFSGKYGDLSERPTLGGAAGYKVADNDTTNNSEFLATARVAYEHGLEIDALSRDLAGLSFGQDADGNWGYKTGGADTVIPFKGYPDFDYEHGISIPYVVAAGNPNVLHYYTMTAEDAAYSYLALFAVTAGSVVSIELSGVSGPSIVCNKPGGSYSFVLIANPVLNGKVNFRHGGTGDGHVYKLRIR